VAAAKHVEPSKGHPAHVAPVLPKVPLSQSAHAYLHASPRTCPRTHTHTLARPPRARTHTCKHIHTCTHAGCTQVRQPAGTRALRVRDEGSDLHADGGRRRDLTKRSTSWLRHCSASATGYRTHSSAPPLACASSSGRSPTGPPPGSSSKNATKRRSRSL